MGGTVAFWWGSVVVDSGGDRGTGALSLFSSRNFNSFWRLSCLCAFIMKYIELIKINMEIARSFALLSTSAWRFWRAIVLSISVSGVSKPGISDCGAWAGCGCKTSGLIKSKGFIGFVTAGTVLPPST